MKVNIQKRSVLDYRPYPFVDFVVKQSLWCRVKHRVPLFVFGVMCFVLGFVTKGML